MCLCPLLVTSVALAASAGYYAYSEEDLAYALTVPNIVVGLKSHIVPTGKVKSDTSLFPYVQFPITIGAFGAVAF